METLESVNKNESSSTDKTNHIEKTSDVKCDNLKYSKNINYPLLNGNKIILPKFTEKQIQNLKQKYISKVPGNKIQKKSDVNKNKKELKKGRKRRNKSDPEVNSITNLLNNSLLIKSPKKRLSTNEKDMNSSIFTEKLDVDNNEEINKDNNSSDDSLKIENKVVNKIKVQNELSVKKSKNDAKNNIDIHILDTKVYTENDGKNEETSAIDRKITNDKMKKSKKLSNEKRRSSLSLKNNKLEDKLEDLSKKEDRKSEIEKLDTMKEDKKLNIEKENKKLDEEKENKSDLKKDSKELDVENEDKKSDKQKGNKKSDVKENIKSDVKKENKKLYVKKEDKKSDIKKKGKKSDAKKEDKKSDVKEENKDSNVKKVVFRTDENIEISPNAPLPSTNTTGKKNAFQFMMDSRHKSIGQNSPGKERVEETSNLIEKNVSKVKLKKRKLFLEGWADKKGGLKRKIEEEAKGKYIEKTLTKRAKRLKSMLLLKNDENDEDDFTLNKSKNRKSKILSESESSNDSTDLNVDKGELSNNEETEESEKLDDKTEKHNKKSDEVNKNAEKFDENAKIHNQEIFSPKKSESPLISTPSSLYKKSQSNENKDDDIIFSPSLKRTSLLHYFDVTNKSKEVEELSKNIENISTKSKDIDESDLIKIKINFTPKKSKNDDSIFNDSLSLSGKSKKIRKRKKRSLSLRKIEHVDDSKSLKDKNDEIEVIDDNRQLIKEDKKENIDNKKENVDSKKENIENKQENVENKMKNTLEHFAVQEDSIDIKNKEALEMEVDEVNENSIVVQNDELLIEDENIKEINKNSEENKINSIKIDSDDCDIVENVSTEKSENNSLKRKTEHKTPKHKKSHHKKKEKHKYNNENSNSQSLILSPEESSVTGKEINGVTPKSKKLENSNDYTPRTWRMKLRLCEESEKKIPETKDDDVVIICDDLIFPSDSDSNEALEVVSENDSKKDLEIKKNVKIAPLFLMQQRRSDMAAAKEAKKMFLHSGVPLKMKKIMVSQPKILSNEDVILFPKISHVQQITEDEMDLWDLPNKSLMISEVDNNDFDYNLDSMSIGSVTDCTSNYDTKLKKIRFPPTSLSNIKTLIRNLKMDCPHFPVYKIFRILQQKFDKRYNLPKELIYEEKKEIKVEETKPVRKRGRPKKKKEPVIDNSVIIDLKISDLTPSQNVEMSASSVGHGGIWTEKYKPQSYEEIIGNNSSVLELKNWLSSWVEYSIEQRSTNRRRRRLNSNSSNDFCSDSDTRDTDIIPLNTIILLGPCGSGKTSTVYALCNELKINIIELNASSKRPGKRILQELQEATKSHHVKNTDSTSVNSFFQKINTDDNIQDNDKKEMTLLLVEDADIVFDDQDDGFVSALMSLVSSSKRPIIITSSDSNCAHLQKFIAQHKVIQFSNFPSKTLGTWLQILCMVEGIRVDRTEVSKLLDWNKGDIRKTILELQFWTQSGGDQSKEIEKDEFLKALYLNKSSRRVSTESELIVTDESSNLSWMSTDNVQTETNFTDAIKTHETCLQCFIPYEQNDKKGYKLPYPINLGNLWWNIPNIFEIKPTEHNKIFSKLEIKLLENNQNCGETPELFSTQDTSVLNKKTSREELNAIGDMLDVIAFTDIVYKKSNLECDFEPCTEYWKIGLVNSLSFEQNLQSYKETDHTSIELTQWLIENNVKQYREISNNKVETLCYNSAVPVCEERRWRKKQHKTMEGLTDAIPVQIQVERRSLFIDYFSSLRTICRSEQIRFIANNRRKNRFYHYLKGLNVHLSDSMYEVVCNTLAHYENF